MIPTVSQVCSLPADFESQLDDYAAGEVRNIDLWLTKTEAYLNQLSVDSPVEQLGRLLDWTEQFGRVCTLVR